ncbi:MAG: hypothetical protein ACMUIA_04205 [bacterium]
MARDKIRTMVISLSLKLLGISLFVFVSLFLFTLSSIGYYTPLGGDLGYYNIPGTDIYASIWGGPSPYEYGFPYNMGPAYSSYNYQVQHPYDTYLYQQPYNISGYGYPNFGFSGWNMPFGNRPWYGYQQAFDPYGPGYQQPSIYNMPSYNGNEYWDPYRNTWMVYDEWNNMSYEKFIPYNGNPNPYSSPYGQYGRGYYYVGYPPPSPEKTFLNI